jgi:hypothetical protein
MGTARPRFPTSSGQLWGERSASFLHKAPPRARQERRSYHIFLLAFIILGLFVVLARWSPAQSEATDERDLVVDYVGTFRQA